MYVMTSDEKQEFELYQLEIRRDKSSRELDALRNLQITAISLKSQLRALDLSIAPDPDTYNAIRVIIDDADRYIEYAQRSVLISEKQIAKLKETTTNV